MISKQLGFHGAHPNDLLPLPVFGKLVNLTSTSGAPHYYVPLRIFRSCDGPDMNKYLSTCFSSPVQSKPPFSALGLSHDLILVLCPFPQVTLQYVHLFHSPHCPWTGQVCAVQDSVSFLLKKGNKIKIKFGDLHEF